jgi:hypothetical protein
LTRPFTPEDVERLAELVGLRIPPEDMRALAKLLTEHRALVDPLLQLELPEVDPALAFDPRWRD